MTYRYPAAAKKKIPSPRNRRGAAAKNWNILLALMLVVAPQAAAFQRPGETERVSVASDGTQGNSLSFDSTSAISADGRFVTFQSFASNLVPGDTNGVPDVFVHDRATGLTERVSVASDGTQANGTSRAAVISADGRYVAFVSEALNLVPGQTDRCFLPCRDVFVHDRETGTTERVSVTSNGAEANDRSHTPSISADGRYVAFSSEASNLVPDDTNGAEDVFVHDHETGFTELVSVATDGTQGDAGTIQGTSQNPCISADGRSVGFESFATNFAANDIKEWWDVFVHDRFTGTTELVSVASDGTPGNGGVLNASSNSGDCSISADGRYVAFFSFAMNLVPGDTNRWWDAFVHDRETGITERVSVASDGSQAPRPADISQDTTVPRPAISADGRYVAFQSFAPTLVPGDTNEVYDVFVHDRATGTTEDRKSVV